MRSTPDFANTYDRRIRGQETRRIDHSTSRQQFRQPIVTGDQRCNYLPQKKTHQVQGVHEQLSDQERQGELLWVSHFGDDGEAVIEFRLGRGPRSMCPDTH